MFDQLASALATLLPDEVARGVAGLTLLSLLMIAVEIVDRILGGRLDQWGVRPRSIRGVIGIGPAPLLHGGFGHLSMNIGPLIILGGLVAVSSAGVLVTATVAAWIASGAGAWLFGRRRSVHIGASGLVFGYLGFVLGRAVLVQSDTSVVIALIAGVVYGGILWGVLPQGRGRSWQGHLFGLLGGFAAAAYVF